MKITAIDTVQVAEFPSLVFVRVHTDDGLVGLGETFFHAEAVEAHVHSRGRAVPARQRTPASIERHAPRRCARTSAARRAAPRCAPLSADRHRALGPVRPGRRPAAAPAARRRVARRDPHVQHLRRLPLRPRPGTSQAVDELGPAGRTPAEGPVRGSRRVPAPRRRARARACSTRASPAMKIWPFDPYAEATRRPRHLDRRARTGARAVPQDPRARSARRWTSWSSCTRSGTCRRRAGSSARWSRSTRSGSRIPSGSTSAGRARRGAGARRRRRSPPARRSRAWPAFRDLLARGGARDRDPRHRLGRRLRRRARSRRWPRRTSGRSRRTTAPGRSSTPPRRTSRCTRRTRSCRRRARLRERLVPRARDRAAGDRARAGHAAGAVPGSARALRPEVLERADVHIRTSRSTDAPEEYDAAIRGRDDAYA